MPKRHKLKIWTNTGPYRKAHTIVFKEMKEKRGLVELKHPNGNKTLISKTRARFLWNEYIDLGWKVAK